MPLDQFPEARPESAVRRYTANQTDGGCADSDHGPFQGLGEHVDHGLLEGGAHVRKMITEVGLPFDGREIVQVIQHACLDSGEREIIAVQPRTREVVVTGITLLGVSVDFRATRPREAKHFADLVKCLTCCIVPGTPQNGALRAGYKMHKLRVSARYDQDQHGEGGLVRSQKQRFHVAVEVVNIDNRDAESQREGLGKADADDEGANEPRTPRDRYAGHVLELHTGLTEGFADGRHEQPLMCSGGQLGHHAAECQMVCLGRHNGRQHAPVGHNGCGCIVTGGLYAQNDGHPQIFTLLLWDLCKTIGESRTLMILYDNGIPLKNTMRRLLTVSCFILMLGIAIPAQAQLRGANTSSSTAVRLYDAGSTGLSLNRFFSPEHFRMSHSFDMSASSYNGGSTLGMYTNSLMWQFNSKLAARVDMALAYGQSGAAESFSSTGGQNGRIFLRNAEVEFRPTENMRFNLQVRQSPFGAYMDPYGYRNSMMGNRSSNLFWNEGLN